MIYNALRDHTRAKSPHSGRHRSFVREAVRLGIGASLVQAPTRSRAVRPVDQHHEVAGDHELRHKSERVLVGALRLEGEGERRLQHDRRLLLLAEHESAVAHRIEWADELLDDGRADDRERVLDDLAGARALDRSDVSDVVSAT